jgi:hypothetical protein
MLNAVYKTFFILMSYCIFSGFTEAGSASARYHGDFWYPTYHIYRLNYCLVDGKTCGKIVADRYCKLMGYAGSDRALIEYNVGRTNYLLVRNVCDNWKCNGFKRIRCVNKIIHKPAAPYYYRYKKYVLPRYNQFRIDWCLEKNKACGKPAAYSFCRRLGYHHASGFKKAEALPSTKTLKSQEICFGQGCNGFSEITCFR